MDRGRLVNILGILLATSVLGIAFIALTDSSRQPRAKPLECPGGLMNYGIGTYSADVVTADGQIAESERSNTPETVVNEILQRWIDSEAAANAQNTQAVEVRRDDRTASFEIRVNDRTVALYTLARIKNFWVEEDSLRCSSATLDDLDRERNDADRG